MAVVARRYQNKESFNPIVKILMDDQRRRSVTQPPATRWSRVVETALHVFGNIITIRSQICESGGNEVDELCRAIRRGVKLWRRPHGKETAKAVGSRVFPPSSTSDERKKTPECFIVLMF